MAAQSIRIANERDKALMAEERAREAEKTAEERRNEAEQSRNDALIAKNDEAKQRKLAEDSLDRAESETKRANEEKTKAQKAQKAEAEQRIIAVNSLREANEQKAVAQTQTTLAKQQKTRADERAVEANEQKAIAVNEAERKRRLLYVSQMNLASQAWEQADTLHLNELLENQIPDAGQTDLRGFEWYLLWRLSHPMAINLHDIATSAFSVDGKRIIGYSLVKMPTIGAVRANPSFHLRHFDSTSGRELDSKAHTGYFPLKFTPDGTKLLVTSGEQAYRGFQTSFFQFLDLRTNQISPNKILSFGSPRTSFSPDTSLLAVREEFPGGKIGLWEVSTGRKKFTVEEQRTKIELQNLNNATTPFVWFQSIPDPTMSFSSDNKIFASGGVNPISVWDLESGAKLLSVDLNKSTEKIKSLFAAVALSPDGKTLAVDNRDGSVKLWDVRTNLVLARLISKDGNPTSGFPSLAYSPDGQLLAASRGRIVTVWDIGTQKELIPIKGIPGKVVSVAFSHDGAKLETVLETGGVSVWDVPVVNNAQTAFTDLTSGRLSPDGRIFVSAGRDGRLRFMDFETNSELAVMGDLSSITKKTFQSPRISSNGLFLGVFKVDANAYLSDYADRDIEIWNVSSKKSMFVLANKGADFQFSPDAKTLATVDNAGVIRLWDVVTGELRSIRQDRVTSSPKKIAFSPGGSKLIFESDSRVKMVDLASGVEQISDFELETGIRREMGFSSDGDVVAIIQGDEIVLVRLTTLELEGKLKESTGKNYTSVAFSRDGQRLAAASYNGLNIWDMNTLSVIASVQTDLAPDRIEFSLDAKKLIASGLNVRIWHGATDDEVQKQRGR